MPTERDIEDIVNAIDELAYDRANKIDVQKSKDDLKGLLLKVFVLPLAEDEHA